MDIGSKIKHLRKQKELTLEELASRSELSKGFLSQLERNLASPSIATLDDILEALGSSLSEFFRDESDERFIFRKSDHYIDEREGYTVNWIVPNGQKNEMESVLLEIPEGGKSFEMPPHAGEEFIYVLDGVATLCRDGKNHTVKKGETVYLHGNSFHHIQNDRKNTAKVLWISTPPLFGC